VVQVKTALSSAPLQAALKVTGLVAAAVVAGRAVASALERALRSGIQWVDAPT